MSTFVQRSVTCRNCGQAQERDVASSINASRTPDWRDRILDGTFQRFRCPACGEVTTFIEPFVYLDFARHQYIGVFPEDDEVRWRDLEDEPADAFERNLGSGAPTLAREIGSDFFVRTVFGLDALREKLVLLDAGLDDGLLEILKLRLLLDRPEVVPVAANRLRLVDASPQQLTLTDSVGEHVVINREEYDAVRDDSVLAVDLRATLQAGPYVDAGRVLLHDNPA